MRRKEYQLAKLRKEYETLANRVRFILGVISEEIKVNKVKKAVIIERLITLGFMKQSDLNLILKEEKKAVVVSQEQNEDELNQSSLQEEQNLGPASSKEFDYLLSMPIYSLTEEKVDELQRQMNEKKRDHDTLEKKPIFDIWQEDLDVFLVELEKYEEKEEKDRQAHSNKAEEYRKKGGKGKKNVGKKNNEEAKKKDIVKKSPQQTKKGNNQKGNIQSFMGKSDKKQPTGGVIQQKKKEEIYDMSLADRLKMKNLGAAAPLQKHYPMGSALSEMSQIDKEAFMLGNQKRRAPRELGSPDDNKENKANYARRHVINDDDESAFEEEKKSEMTGVMQPKASRVGRNVNQKRIVIESDSEEEYESSSFDEGDADMMGDDDSL